MKSDKCIPKCRVGLQDRCDKEGCLWVKVMNKPELVVPIDLMKIWRNEDDGMLYFEDRLLTDRELKTIFEKQMTTDMEFCSVTENESLVKGEWIKCHYFYPGDISDIYNDTDWRFCAVPGIRKKVLFLGTAYVNFPIVYPIKLTNGEYVQDPSK